MAKKVTVAQPKPKKLAVSDVKAKIGYYGNEASLNKLASGGLYQKSLEAKSPAEKKRLQDASTMGTAKSKSMGDSVKKYSGILQRGLAAKKKK